ncbi:exported hypothetical protein [Candidatus Terasakiella magnetica]|uniref:Uncharacterized protein n=1 Tax=Candidatus Terasakiella magnetica TaxID=1867952 RepID=A0A1C3RDG1_9PROT|nr:hypothetical protein [Candidatus Terasakiella magnetica]SCA55330.1 exported hypothetical protein [Candidatus Terasakiella magnetica]
MAHSRNIILMVILCYAALVGLYFIVTSMTQDLLKQSVTQTTQSANKTVTKIFVNEIFPEISGVLDIDNRKEGVEGEVLSLIDTKIRTFMLGTDVLKVKLFSMAGLTLFSTEHAQINQTRKDNPAFQTASQGGIGSQITHKGKFSAIDQMVFDKDLVSSYVPIRNKRGQIKGVVEIYTDRTREVRNTQALLTSLKSSLIIGLSGIGLCITLLMWVGLYRKSQA